MSMQFSLNALRFEDVRQQVVEFLKDRNQGSELTAEFDYQGSNISYIIDTMAYTTMLMSYMLANQANEIFLDTATLRKNAVSIAKTLGYRPKRVNASQIQGTFTYTSATPFIETSKVVIPANTKFTGEVDGFTWVNLEPINLEYNPKNPYVLSSAVNEVSGRSVLVQGIWRQYRVLGSGENLQSFTIPVQNIDENNLKIFIKNTADANDLNKVEWTYAKTFFEILTDTIYFVEEDLQVEGAPKVIFGNTVVGRPPRQTETIIAEYLETKGADGDGETAIIIPATTILNKSFDISAINLAALKFVVPANTASYGGSAYETITSVKNNAPRYFAAAGRAVTGNDFETVIDNEFGHIVDYFSVIGGDDLDPGNRDVLGNAYITATPAGVDLNTNLVDSQAAIYLSESAETSILATLKNVGIIATQKFFLKPSYIYLNVEPTIEMSRFSSAAERQAILEAADVNLKSFFTNDLADFGLPFRESKVRSVLDITTGVISSKVGLDYGFILTKDTFYIYKDTLLYLPVRLEKDSSGQLAKDDQGNVITTNFIKTNTTLMAEKNSALTRYEEIFRLNVDSTLGVTEEQTQLVWHNGDDYYHPWLSDATAVDSTTTTWELNINQTKVADATHVALGGGSDTFVINELSDSTTLEFLEKQAKIQPNFNITLRNSTLGIDYHSVAINRIYDEVNMQQEVKKDLVINNTSLYGKLTHTDLDRYLYNNDSLTAKPADLVINAGSLYYDTFTIKGTNSAEFSVSLTLNEALDGTYTYSLIFNDTNSNDKATVANLVWDSSGSGLGQFTFENPDFIWLEARNFKIQGISPDQFVFSIVETGVDRYAINCILSSDLSALKIRGKSMLGAFTYDATDGTAKYTVYDSKTRSFTDDAGTATPLVFAENVLGTLQASWCAYPMLTVTEDGTTETGLAVTIDSTNAFRYAGLGMREHLVVEPYRIIINPDPDAYEYVDGFAVYVYDLFHGTTIGRFEYKTGECDFDKYLIGYTTTASTSLFLRHIREVFDNYTEDVLMDVITILPDNEYKTQDGREVVIGSLTDFDGIFSQIVRANISAAAEVLV